MIGLSTLRDLFSRDSSDGQQHSADSEPSDEGEQDDEQDNGPTIEVEEVTITGMQDHDR